LTAPNRFGMTLCTGSARQAPDDTDPMHKAPRERGAAWFWVVLREAGRTGGLGRITPHATGEPVNSGNKFAPGDRNVPQSGESRT
jgi:hypothetical protein